MNIYLRNSALLVLAVAALAPTVSARLGSHRKLQNAAAGGKAVPGQFIVMMNDDVQDVQGALNGVLHANDNAKISHVFGHVFKGLLLSHVPEQALQRILDSSAVKVVYEVSQLSSSI